MGEYRNVHLIDKLSISCAALNYHKLLISLPTHNSKHELSIVISTGPIVYVEG